MKIPRVRPAAKFTNAENERRLDLIEKELDGEFNGEHLSVAEKVDLEQLRILLGVKRRELMPLPDVFAKRKPIV